MERELVTFDGAIYSITAVKKAAYRFLDAFSADISTEGAVIKCALTFTSERGTEAIERTISDFRKEVLDQDLRESLKRETEPVRNLILAHAFSKTGIVSQ
jgi:His-Xaa-Ser system protein HxsD